MKSPHQNGRVRRPGFGRDERGDIAIAAGRIVAIGRVAPTSRRTARSTPAAGGRARPGRPGRAAARARPRARGHARSEMAAAMAGGVTSLVCRRHRPAAGRARPGGDAQVPRRNLNQARLFLLGADARAGKGRGAHRDGRAHRGRLRRLQPGRGFVRDTRWCCCARSQYAADLRLRGLAAPQGPGWATASRQGPLATRWACRRAGAIAETIALATLFELVRHRRACTCAASAPPASPWCARQGRGACR